MKKINILCLGIIIVVLVVLSISNISLSNEIEALNETIEENNNFKENYMVDCLTLDGKYINGQPGKAYTVCGQK